MPVLDSTFFAKHTSKSHGDCMYEGYECKFARSTMVLFSVKTKTPLAALVFTPRDYGETLSLLTQRPVPKGADSDTLYFQGMLNKGNQEFNFTIVNLGLNGMINFNILHTPHQVSEINPGPAFGINQVNELYPGQTYTIPADQRTNKTMILVGLTKSAPNGSAQPVSVKEAEEKQSPPGVYFHLSVVPQEGCSDLIDKFKEGTVWKCVSCFVRKVPAPKEKAVHKIFIMGHLDDDHETGETMSPDDGHEIEETYSAQLKSSNAATVGRVVSAVDYIDDIVEPDFETSPPPPNEVQRIIHLVEDRKEEEEEDSGDDNDDSGGGDNGGGDNGGGDGGDDGEIKLVESSHNYGAHRKKKRKMKSMAAVDSMDIEESQAGTIRYGQDVRVVSGKSGKDYAYEFPSCKAVLCLSIFPSMHVLPLENMDAQMEEEMKDWMENHGKHVLDALNAIYASDTCVIDLESPADTVIVQCGHQCVNFKNIGNLTKCPLCRGHAASFIRADGLIMK